VTGGLFGAVIPASLVYIGDTVPVHERQRAFAGLMATTALGTAFATVVSGSLAAFASWRIGFAAPAVAAALLAVLLGRVAEPAGRPEGGALEKIGKVARRPWAVLVITVALIEGLVAFGGIPYLAPALEASGHSPAVAGLAVAVFGLALFAWSQVVKRALERWRPPMLMAIGGCAFALGYGAAAATQEVPGIVAAAIFTGGGFAFLHTGLQAWATDVAPEARATTIAFFASGLFVGSAIATGLLGPLADDGRYALLFGLCAAGSFPLGLAAALARERYARGAVRARPLVDVASPGP
jgi:predicted MFS family arabinose efflux permease